MTTGPLTLGAQRELTTFQERLIASSDLQASLELVGLDVLETRLVEAEGRELPTIDHDLFVEPDKTLVATINGTRTVVAAVALKECLRVPGILDGRLFRKNVRQFLGLSNKVNRGIRQTLNGDRSGDFFFYHNGITALCRGLEIRDGGTKLHLEDLSVVNGCQSLTTIYQASQRVRALPEGQAYVLFRFYEIPQRDLADRISVATNSQSTVKPRDLRSNERVMLALKRAYETQYPDGLFIAQRGTDRPADKDMEKTVDCAELAKALMAWHCQRPNISHNEKRLFDEHYKTLFRSDYDPASILALRRWMSLIEGSWQNLDLNDALKAGKSYVRFHLLYIISSLIAHASKQPDKIAEPAMTLAIASQSANDLLRLAVNCLNQALAGAIQEVQLAGRVFSPQNWCKSLASVRAETLTASTTVSMLPGLGAQETLDRLTVEPRYFGLRWSAE